MPLFPGFIRDVLRTKHRLLRLFRLSLLLVVLVLSHGLRATEVIVNRAVPERVLTLNVMRLIFTMRLLRWQDGSRVKVFVLPDHHAVHREFAKRSLHLYPRQLRRVWDRNLYSGAGAVPVEIASVEEMAKRVAETPGAIGYLPDGFARDTVRVIHVE